MISDVTLLRAWPAAFLIGACAAQVSQPRGVSQPPPSDAHTASFRADAERIELCKTSEADLRATFGPPRRDGRVERFRVQSWLVGKDPEHFLEVLLDSRAVVVNLAWDTPGDLTWIPRDLCATSSP
jgi:hypothetical protein